MDFVRFMYLRAPWNLLHRRMDEAFEGMCDFRKIVDDMLAFDSDPHDHIEHVRQHLQCCQESISQ